MVNKLNKIITINKKSQAIAVDMVVKIILGITIFSLGFMLFTQLFSESGNEIEDINNQLKTDLQNIECSNSESLCLPSVNLKSGKVKNSNLIVINSEKVDKTYSINITLTGGKFIEKSCGKIEVDYYNKEFKVNSQTSSQIPIQVYASKILKKPCNFISTISLKEGGAEINSIPLIVNIN